ncbi:uncharacterized protein LOC116288002 [Actinia tenebrosa]|uniref:DNA-directed DNA polymerase n=1 Tax=Actinia tenebrosa TaxID=6105 RepID=A0A6P8H4V3_ACTTE|nr:uncharacterized protein LOC116288002 [Actinia tenebrosa]
MPAEKELSYEDFKRQTKVPYVIYADFESIITKENQENGATKRLGLHEICSYGYIVVRHDGKADAPVIYRGKNAANKFLEALQDEEEKGEKPGKPSTHCIHCHKRLVEDFYMDKVLDYCSVTGAYVGAAHWRCRTHVDPEMEIPVFFHNLRGYDSHLLLQGTDGSDVKCIPNNKERYMSVTVGKLKFLDSQQFMADSLVNRVKYNTDFPISSQYGAERKGVYPYEYMDSWERFEEPLPSKERVYSTLTESGIKDEEYQHALDVWQKYGCRTRGNYHVIYLRSDVVLLADVFQSFRKMAMEYYDLDPANFYTAPGLSWSALLKKTNEQLHLLTEYDMYRFMEDGIRGGVCGPSRRFARANNPAVEYDPEKPTTYIFYLDANNLYGVDKESDKGYVLEVDLEYPEHLHDAHDEFPLAPEAIEIPSAQLSPLQQQMCPNYKPYRKLTMNLMDKRKYVVHYRNLQFYVRHGMRVKKIHRVLKFTQKPWMQPYIASNTQKRTAAKNDFENYGHHIHSVTQEKVSLSAFDGKRWMCDDGIHTMAFGHHTISSSSLTNPRVGPS